MNFLDGLQFRVNRGNPARFLVKNRIKMMTPVHKGVAGSERSEPKKASLQGAQGPLLPRTSLDQRGRGVLELEIRERQFRFVGCQEDDHADVALDFLGKLFQMLP